MIRDREEKIREKFTIPGADQKTKVKTTTSKNKALWKVRKDVRKGISEAKVAKGW